MRWRWQLTTVWTDGHVYLILSDGYDQNPRFKSCTRIKSAMCSGFAYESVAGEILRASDPGSTRLVWAVLMQSFPFGSFDEIPGGKIVRIPDWLEQCWSDLPFKLLPGSVCCGMDALKHYLGQSGNLAVPGSGIYAVLDGRSYFLGYGEEDTFIRITRDAMIDQPEGMGLREDWLQQTSMLYRNRTGYELSRIQLLQDQPSSVVQPANVVLNTGPINSGNRQFTGDRDLPLLVGCLGSVVMECGDLRKLRFQLLEQKSHRIRMNSAYRLGAGLLLLGWITLLLGACKHGFSEKDSAELMREWEDAGKIWRTGSERLRIRSGEFKQKTIELSIMGLIGRSLPGAIKLERIRIERDARAHRELTISLSGEFNPSETSSVLNDWLDRLIGTGVIDRVKDLKFDQSGDMLKFHLSGEATTGDGMS